MSQVDEKFKRAIKNMKHWFRAIEHESKMLEFNGDAEERITEGLVNAEKLPETYRKAALFFLQQARVEFQAGNENSFRVNFLRAIKQFEYSHLDDLETGRSRKQLGGKTTAEIRKKERQPQAAKAAEIYDSLTLEPRYRAAVIAKRMQLHPKTIREYLKETNRR